MDPSVPGGAWLSLSPSAGIPERDKRPVARDEADAVPAVKRHGEGRLQYPRVYDVVDPHVTSCGYH